MEFCKVDEKLKERCTVPTDSQEALIYNQLREMKNLQVNFQNGIYTARYDTLQHIQRFIRWNSKTNEKSITVMVDKNLIDRYRKNLQAAVDELKESAVYKNPAEVFPVVYDLSQKVQKGVDVRKSEWSIASELSPSDTQSSGKSSSGV